MRVSPLDVEMRVDQFIEEVECTDGKRYKCSMCTARYSVFQDAACHFVGYHTGYLRQKCSKKGCPFRSKTTKDIRVHLANAH